MNWKDLREHVTDFDLEAVGTVYVPLKALKNLRILELECQGVFY